MTVYIFGNPLLPNDSIPIKWKGLLRKAFPEIIFELVDPNENFPRIGKRNLTILDTVVGIKEPMILDLEDFEKNKKSPISPHDYDLLMHLLLLKKLKKIDKVKIIGVPNKENKKTFDKLVELIRGNQLLISLPANA